ncbi:NAD(P)H-quinone dehydrogenase [Actinocorallia populi]|uniref:NAD(P)H-quinone dehydrogenase n=1 Tax=Actinocorallia populi TaxID=2079200 RepID=UPI001E480B8D|nr:NAD(P)H-quinone dehydrogenase [Actinocorallia populi]
MSTRIVILGGGPGGYEAALVAARLGADVTVVERDGPGGASVLYDCVPSKTLIATSVRMSVLSESAQLGVRFDGGPDGEVGGVAADLPLINRRVKDLARAQSFDVADRLGYEEVKIVRGEGRLDGPRAVVVGDRRIEADMVIIATGATPRVLPGAEPDGERILTWRQLYDLDELPEELIVVGSGVTGAEFAGAYLSLGSKVTLVSSRDRILPSQDAEAASVLEEVYRRRGMNLLSRSRAGAVERSGDGVVVTLEDGRKVRGSHCLMTVGMVPNTRGIGLEKAGVKLGPGGYVETDKVSRTSVPNIYAAGDCTGILALASVAAMQGRIAVWHALGEAVQPLKLGWVSSNIFTDPEVASVGVTQQMVDNCEVDARTVMLPLNTNARAKMQGSEDGFIKLFCRRSTGIVLGGVIVSPRASELIMTLAVAVQQHLTVDQLAHTFTVYPSLSGSIQEAANRLTVDSAY